jgi:glycosidase
MKKVSGILLSFLFVILLASCKDLKAQPTLEVNIDNGYTITQYVGDETIDLSGIQFTDTLGQNYNDQIQINGFYDLSSIGFYDVTLTVSIDDDSISRDVYLKVVEKTCDDFPNLPQCPVLIDDFYLTDDTQQIDTIFVGDFIKVHWTIVPDNADNKVVHLTSSNPQIATVSDYGYVFGQSEGTVTITFTTEDGNHTITKDYIIRYPNCEEDPLQDQCVYLFLTDDSRLVSLDNPNISQTDYSSLHPNNRNYYEIFVRKFADSDHNYIGDFNGIADNLAYLKSLGIGGLWLMPIFESSSDHGYDTNDYFSVNPDYGSEADFEQLLSKASEQDIDIILDLVINHMGAHNEIFQDVLKNGTSSPYYNWFTWIESDDPRINDKGSWGQTIWYNPTNRYWLKSSTYTINPSLANKYYFGYFSDWMPDLNLENPDVIQYIYSIADYWLSKGVHGFRMDATSHLYALGEYPDVINRNQANIDFLSAFNNHVKTLNPNAYIVVEAWEPADVYIPYFQAGVSPFDFQGSYNIKDAANDRLGSDIGDSLNALYQEMNDYNPNFIDSIFLSNHDMNRVAMDVENKEELRQAAEILFTTKSNPFIYYGDEIGMLGTRTNMVFGNYYPGLNVEYEDREIQSVTEQLNDESSLLNTYKKLATLRNNSLALSYGDFIPYSNDSLQGYFRVFENGIDKELILVLFNFSDTSTFPIPTEIGSYEILYSSFSNNIGGLSPNSTLILRLPYDEFIDLTH